MPYPTYPLADDLQAFLGTPGLDIPPTLDLASKVESAIDEWEERTGWGPYLSTGQPEMRLFDPPCHSKSLYLQSGLLSLTSLKVGVVPRADGSYAPGSGTLLINNRNFYAHPKNAAVRGLVATEIEFLSPVRGVPQSIAITGVWGRVLQVPGDVWQAVLQKAAALCAPELAVGISGGVYERREGDEMVRFGGSADGGPLAQQIALWESNFDRLAGRKKRLVA